MLERITSLICMIILMVATLSGCYATATPRGGIRVGVIQPGVIVTTPPPPPRPVIAVRPVSPHGQATWVDGHWRWNGRRYVWVEGHWVGYRANHRYMAPRWERRGNGWVYYEGQYVR